MMDDFGNALLPRAEEEMAAQLVAMDRVMELGHGPNCPGVQLESIWCSMNLAEDLLLLARPDALAHARRMLAHELAKKVAERVVVGEPVRIDPRTREMRAHIRLPRVWR